MPKNENEIVRIELTPTQKEKVKSVTDKNASDRADRSGTRGPHCSDCAPLKQTLVRCASRITPPPRIPTTPRSDLVPDAALCFYEP